MDDEQDGNDLREVVFDRNEVEHTVIRGNKIKNSLEGNEEAAKVEITVQDEREATEQKQQQQQGDQGEQEQEQELEIKEQSQSICQCDMENNVLTALEENKILSHYKLSLQEQKQRPLQQQQEQGQEQLSVTNLNDKNVSEEASTSIEEVKEVEIVDDFPSAQIRKESDDEMNKKKMEGERDDMILEMEDDGNDKMKRKLEGRGKETEKEVQKEKAIGNGRKGKGKGKGKREGMGKGKGRQESEDKILTELEDESECEIKTMKVKMTDNNTKVPDRRSTFRFLFGSGNEEEVFQAKLAVEMLGGSVIFPIESKFDESCTHLILWEVKRTEKYLCACAAGKVSDLLFLLCFSIFIFIFTLTFTLILTYFS